MKRRTPENQKKRAPGIKGICGHARELGVTRFHLLRVLNGTRQSPRLLKRYRQLFRKN